MRGRFLFNKLTVGAVLACALAACGCGTTRWTDTDRTGTEQLLISDSIDQSVSQIDFALLHGQTVFLDAQALSGTPDQRYLISSVREVLMDGGCYLMPTPDGADYIVELRSGGLGTDRNDRLLLGVPQLAMPVGLFGPPVTIPEIALIKETEQTGVAKIGVFVYEKETGRPVWKSGLVQNQSKLDRLWLLGAGPYEEGYISRQPRTFMHRFARLITSWRGEAGREPRTDQDMMMWQEAIYAVPGQDVPPHPAAGEPIPAPPPDLLPEKRKPVPLPDLEPLKPAPEPPRTPERPLHPPKLLEVVEPPPAR